MTTHQKKTSCSLITYFLFFSAAACSSKEHKKEAVAPKTVTPAATAPTSLPPTGEPQYIIKDVQISFVGGDEEPPVLKIPAPTKKKAPVKMTQKKSSAAGAQTEPKTAAPKTAKSAPTPKN